jgi:hypothetical protein
MVAPLWEAVALAHYVYFYKELFRADTDCLSAFYGISVVDSGDRDCNHVFYGSLLRRITEPRHHAPCGFAPQEMTTSRRRPTFNTRYAC